LQTAGSGNPRRSGHRKHPYDLTEVSGFAGIATQGIMSTLALVINGVAVSSGKIPAGSRIVKWAHENESNRV
jgi:hypothetical protein